MLLIGSVVSLRSRAEIANLSGSLLRRAAKSPSVQPRRSNSSAMIRSAGCDYQRRACISEALSRRDIREQPSVSTLGTKAATSQCKPRQGRQKLCRTALSSPGLPGVCGRTAPAMNRWAIVACPSGTKRLRRVPDGFNRTPPPLDTPGASLVSTQVGSSLGSRPNRFNRGARAESAPHISPGQRPGKAGASPHSGALQGRRSPPRKSEIRGPEIRRKSEIPSWRSQKQSARQGTAEYAEYAEKAPDCLSFPRIPGIPRFENRSHFACDLGETKRNPHPVPRSARSLRDTEAPVGSGRGPDRAPSRRAARR